MKLTILKAPANKLETNACVFKSCHSNTNCRTTDRITEFMKMISVLCVQCNRMITSFNICFMKSLNDCVWIRQLIYEVKVNIASGIY